MISILSGRFVQERNYITCLDMCPCSTMFGFGVFTVLVTGILSEEYFAVSRRRLSDSKPLNRCLYISASPDCTQLELVETEKCLGMVFDSLLVLSAVEQLQPFEWPPRSVHGVSLVTLARSSVRISGAHGKTQRQTQRQLYSEKVHARPRMGFLGL